MELRPELLLSVEEQSEKRGYDKREQSGVATSARESTGARARSSLHSLTLAATLKSVHSLALGATI
jgi:hypothetical protein